MRGTALRPVYARLSADEAAEFEAEFGRMLCEAYPPQPYGTVLPFRRIFAVAQRPA
jgi:trans-aconitate 2-methyltransferase